MSAELTTYAELADVIDTLPNLLREMRRARGTSLRAAADEMGASYTALFRFEQGKTGVHTTTVVAILRWLDQTPHDGTEGGGDRG